MSKLILIDGNAILHRAFHALPPLTTKRGDPINAVYGLVSMTLKIIQDLKPSYLIVAFDEKLPTFRHKEFKGYQAQRPPMASELSSQFDKAKAFLEAAKIPSYSMPGFEADDVIGTIAYRATTGYGLETTAKKVAVEGRQLTVDEVAIVTGDRDQLQLVDDKKGIKLYMPIVGLSTAKLMGESETKEKMGVSPSLIDDYKALVGDSSDNYPGVPGIGPKTAISLLEKYGTFESIYNNLDKISKTTSDKLRTGEDSGRLSKRLATIVRDVPINLEIDKAKMWEIDSQEVLKLFEEFGFKTLTERIKKVGKILDQEKQGALF